MRVFYLNAMVELRYDEAETGDRITVEYETNRSFESQVVTGNVVYVEINHANDSVIATWFIGDDDRLYQLADGSISRTPDTYTTVEATESLDSYSGKADVKESLTRLDARAHNDVSWVQVVAIESQSNDSGIASAGDDYQDMGDYDLCAAVLNEAREGTLSTAFNALVERQNRVHSDYTDLLAKHGDNEQRRQDVTAVRIRSEMMLDNLNEAMDIAD